MKPAFGWLSKKPRENGRRSRLDYLNLGCGAHFHEDWINVDLSGDDERVLRHNLTEPLPFPDASFSVVYHSHVLEHLSPRQGEQLMRECFRVMKSDGTMRVAVPDLETIARLYLQNLEGAVRGEPEAARRYEWIILELLDQMVREESGGEMLRYWQQQPMPAEDFVVSRMGQEVRRVIQREREKISSRDPQEPKSAKRSVNDVAKFRARGEIHRWMYDRYSLGELLRKAGFHSPRVCTATESAIPEFARFQLDVEPDGSVRKPDSLFTEATR